MSITIEFEDELFRQFITSRDSIFLFFPFHHPNHHQQQLINNFFILDQISKEQSLSQEIAKSITKQIDLPQNLNETVACQGLLYSMIKDQNQIQPYYEIIKILGVQVSSHVLSEFQQIIEFEFAYLKKNCIDNMIIILRLLIEDHREMAFDSFFSFLRNIMMGSQNLSQFFIQIIFHLKETLLQLPIFSALIFLKLLTILSSEISNIPSDQESLLLLFMEAVWQKHVLVLMSFGREFIMKFDSVQKKFSFETAKLFQKFERDLQEKLYSDMPYYLALFQNQTLETDKYRFNYLIVLPFEVEKKIKFMISEQISGQSIKEQLRIFFNNYGNDSVLLSGIIRYLVCLMDFLEERLAEFLLLLYDFSNDKKGLFKHCLFFDWLFFDKHNIQAGHYVLSLLYHQNNYDLLQEFIWFIIIESNNYLEKKKDWIQTNVSNSFRSWACFDKLMNDQQINQKIKIELQNKIQTVDYDLAQSEDTLDKIESEEEEYNPEDIESQYPQLITRQDEYMMGHYLILPAMANFIKQRKLQDLFLYPENQTYYRSYLGAISSLVNSMEVQEPDYLREEVAKLIFNLYNSHLDDFNYKEFNALKSIIQESIQFRKICKERNIVRNQEEYFWVKVIKTLIGIDRNVLNLLIFFGSFEEITQEVTLILKCLNEKDNFFEECLINLFALLSYKEYEALIIRLINCQSLNYLFFDKSQIWNIIFSTLKPEAIDTNLSLYWQGRLMIRNEFHLLLAKVLKYQSLRQNFSFSCLIKNFQNIETKGEKEKILINCFKEIPKILNSTCYDSQIQNIQDLFKDTLKEINADQIGNILPYIFRINSKFYSSIAKIIKLMNQIQTIQAFKFFVSRFTQNNEDLHNLIEIMNQMKNDGSQSQLNAIFTSFSKEIFAVISNLNLQDYYSYILT